MTFTTIIFPVWLMLMLWVPLSGMLGITTKKERLCAITLLDVIAFFASIQCFFTSHHWWSHAIWAFFIYINGKSSYRSYKRWKNTDDDDDWKHRRKSWAKSHIPKPEISRAIPQPV